MKHCPAAASCQWHNKVLAWINSGQTERIRQEKDILLVLLSRAWRGCICLAHTRVTKRALSLTVAMIVAFLTGVVPFAILSFTEQGTSLMGALRLPGAGRALRGRHGVDVLATRPATCGQRSRDALEERVAR